MTYFWIFFGFHIILSSFFFLKQFRYAPECAMTVHLSKFVPPTLVQKIWSDFFVCSGLYVYLYVYLYVSRDWLVCVAWRVHICDTIHYMCAMTHSYVWHDSFMCGTRLFHVFAYVRHNTFICVAWLIHVCDITHSCVWRDSFTCVTWLSHVCDMTMWGHTSEKG